MLVLLLLLLVVVVVVFRSGDEEKQEGIGGKQLEKENNGDANQPTGRI